MEINIIGARKNNLNNISVNIPIGKIIGITGVSGSGKSTLAKDIITKWGYSNYSINISNSIKSLIIDNEPIEVDTIENLPLPLLIDVVNSITNPKSTVSTITNMHTQLRKLFSQYGIVYCPKCGKPIDNNIFNVLPKINYSLVLDLKIDNKFKKRLEEIKNLADIEQIVYFNEYNNIVNKKSLQKFCHIYIKKVDNIKRLSAIVYEKIGKNLKILVPETNKIIDLTNQILCENCNNVFPKNTMKLFSFNIDNELGGGTCSACNGLGKVIKLDVNKLIEDKNKPINKGGIKFIDEKGLKYTKITEKFLQAVAKKYKFTLDMTYNQLTLLQKNVLLYGSNDIISFTDRQGKNNGKKEEVFKGIVFYLEENFMLGKNKKNLEPYFHQDVCDSCKGTRLNSNLEYIKFNEYSIQDMLKSTIHNLNKIINSFLIENDDSKLNNILLDLSSKLKVLDEIGCGYLTLDRECTTLSGGELQRLRISYFLESKINELCVILDEPTTGLHPKDIKYIEKVINKLKQNNNTVIIIEHNKQILKKCDYIVDLGPNGGKDGGNLLFSDYLKNITKYTTQTAKFLTDKDRFIECSNSKSYDNKFIYLNEVSSNNIQKQDVKFPLYQLTTICGVSGSGKSTFIKNILIPIISKNPKKFDVSGIEYLGQKNSIKTKVSNVGSLLNINSKIAKVFSKQNGTLDYSNFMINSKAGKCHCCKGTGYTDNARVEICDTCEGKIFNQDTLLVKYKSFNIYEILTKSIEDLVDIFSDNNELYTIFKNCIEIGIGYLTLSRPSTTLSKGEIQRVKLAEVLSSKKKNNIFILDEPTKGLHNNDISKLYKFILNVIKNKNTVLAIEHNLDFIRSSDYIIEFGPEAGEKGGKVIFNGKTMNLIEYNTPTSDALKNSLESTSNNYKIDENIQKQIHIEIDNKKYLFKTNSINYINENLDSLSKYSNYQYLKVINPLITLKKPNINEHIKINNLPIIRKINPYEKTIKTNNCIIDLLNVNDAISNLFIRANNNYSIPMQVFNKHSNIGKCKVCKGHGKVEAVDLNLIMDNGVLNQETEKLLKKRSNYNIAKKNLKKLYEIDISKNYNDMNSNEKQVFIYGDREKVFIEKNKEYYWEGINKLIISQIEYYEPESIKDKVKSSKMMKICEICNGDLLDSKYRHTNVSGVSYRQFLDYKICDIKDLILSNIKFKNDKSIQKLVTISKLFDLFKLDTLTFNTPIKNLTLCEKGILQYISYKVNNLHNSILFFENIEWLSNENLRNIFIDDVIKMTKTNTIIINKNI